MHIPNFTLKTFDICILFCQVTKDCCVMEKSRKKYEKLKKKKKHISKKCITSTVKQTFEQIPTCIYGQVPLILFVLTLLINLILINCLMNCKDI